MGRITGSVARRRVLVGVVAAGAFALAACAGPLKPAPEPDGAAALPNIQICAPGVTAPRPEARVAAEPGERPCVPFCLPGQEPTPPEQSPFLEPAPEPEVPSCVPICPPDEGGGAPPDENALLAARCVRLPIPCLPGQEPPAEPAPAIEPVPQPPDCVNFCLPGQEGPPPEASAELARCVPLCALAEVIRGVPGLEPCEVAEK
jgi:hypothetical protein